MTSQSDPTGPSGPFCQACGALNQPEARYCARCGASLSGAQPPDVPVRPAQHVPNYLVHAIVVTVLCCLPFGIVAIVYAAQVNGKLAAGDYDGALEASRKARTWCWVSFGVGLAFAFAYAAYMLVVMGFLAVISRA